MEILNLLYNEINRNSSFLGFILSLLIALLISFRYLNQRRQELKDKRFEIYHKMVKDFIGKDQSDLKLDYQIAVCYEFRNFKEYYPLTVRILKAFKTDILKNDPNNRLVKEINLTINFINSNKFHKIIYKYFPCLVRVRN